MTAGLVDYADIATSTIAERRTAATRWARHALSSDAALIIGLRTSHPGGEGFLAEISLIDTSGTIRLNTLVNPRMDIDDSITRNHHLTNEMVAGAPTFDQILPDLLQLTAGRKIAAYNPCAAVHTLLDDTHRAVMDPEHLKDPATWHNIARMRSEWLGRPAHYLPLPNAPRTLAHCHAVLHVIRDIGID